MPSYHFGLSSFVRASKRTVSERVRTWALAVVVSAMKEAGVLPSFRSFETTLVGSESK